MRKLGLPGIVICILVLGVAFAGCSGKDGKDGAPGATGLTGATGETGATGPSGPEGPSGTADCVLCHNDNTELVAAVTQWRHALHSSDAILWETNRGASSWCASCHNSEGFVSTVAGTPTVPDQPTPIGCRTCHAPHTNKDFRLRTQAPVTLKDGVVFDMGKGNLCVACHHSRTDTRVQFPADSTMITVSNSRLGPHEGPQGDAYRGAGGYTFGQTIENSYHTDGVADACVTCHMAKPIGSTVGGHTFLLANDEEGGDNLAACNVSGCHSGAPLTTFDRQATVDWDGNGVIQGTQTEFDGLLDKLRQALVARGALSADDTSIPGRYPKNLAAAVYNFRLALREGSRGIHNTKFIMNLMKLSLENLPAKTNA